MDLAMKELDFLTLHNSLGTKLQQLVKVMQIKHTLESTIYPNWEGVSGTS
jgi:hypothetical protein